MKSVIFLGSKEIGYHTLDHLIQQQHDLRVEVIAVVTNDRMLEQQLSITELCANGGIQVLSTVDEILSLECDIIISVQHHEILRREHIAKAKEITVNLHMAPLPEYRGCNQFSFAIINGASEFGTTIHRLEEGVDSGAIMFERRFSIPDNIFVKELYQLTLEESLILFKENIGAIVNGTYNLQPQNELIVQRGTSYHYRSEIDMIKQIENDWEPEKKKRYFRATYFPPFDPPYIMINGEANPLTMDWYNSIG